ncbi:Lrp/AsnC family transcriptional regulator [Pseudoalteromonas shioyasakiensis]|uniref:Lrp/AsnC family transcriptional regulator n=1 Tax=Pseudoalteromonas shioyasakiensis TaxID=1190813 RepID=UPI0021174B15|nr:Lrp/AsnC family transcriptional regulator [Pseudoalteromonas shioyasakiensis]MCQ8880109.1 Lrp/AsnC family transcriptional regulator [Pseudoalteromonas shioyasakiensis]
MSIDKKDQELLAHLQANARSSIAQLANKVNLSDTPCLRRIKKLESTGVISGYHATIEPKRIGLNVLVYAFVRLNQNSVTAANAFEEQVEKLQHVQECAVVSGSYDYLLKVVATDLEAYEHFVKYKLGSIDYIANIESTVVLKQTFNKKQLPL